MDEPIITTTQLEIDALTPQSASEVTTPSLEAAPTGELNTEFQSSVLNSLVVIIVLLGSILGTFLIRLIRK